jgi:hypothetical protein
MDVSKQSHVQRVCGTYGSRADHVIVRDDAQLPPAVYHGQETEMVVLQPLLRQRAQAELVEKVISQQQFLSCF